MSRSIAALTFAVAVFAAWTPRAQAQTVSQEEFEKLKKEVEEMRRQLGGPTPGSLRAQDPAEVKRKAGTVYSKPFLARFGGGVHIGGYIDLEFLGVEESNSDTFDQHRLVPFIYADVSDAIKVATEIEIEHGGELGVEFAHVDWWMKDSFNFRAGIILDPLGKFNLVHDAPFQDLTLRPLVSEFILGTVLREPGVGFFGTIDADPWKIDYELYLTNGFKGLSKTGTTVISKTSGLRSARPHTTALGTSAYRDFNDNKAVVGRVGLSPFLGLEVGLSMHKGTYDERSDNDLTITVVDLTLSGGSLHQKLFGGGEGTLRDVLFAIEIVGEFARATLQRDALAEAAGVPEDLSGNYIEIRYHFMFDALRKMIPGASDESTFTFVVRRDALDLDGAKRDGTTVGLNFRPREQTVVKLEWSKRGESGDAADVDDDRYTFSVATYF